MKRPVHTDLLAVLPNLSGGGAERVTLNLLNNLVEQGRQVGLLSFSEAGHLRKSLSRSASHHVLSKRSLRCSILPMVFAVRRLKPSIVFSTLGYVNVAILALRPVLPRRTKIWVREANLPSMSLPRNRFPRLMRWAYTLLYRRADLVICSSVIMRHEMTVEFGVPTKKVRVLSNPVDESEIRDRARSMPLPRTEGRRFVAVGRLVPQKGFDRLLTMFAELRDVNAELVIIGEGPLEQKLRLQAATIGIDSNVRFIGFTDNPWAYIATSDIFVLSSRWEGMPNAALEALACGVPVIATPESGGIAEVAAAAIPGAVILAEAGQPFIDQMKKVVFRPDCALAPSLLPPEYRAETVVNSFASWLDDLS